ncbi:hypothetical protein [Sphingomonas sp. PB1R3]|uniref:hypothetical protein n=1 Tax=Sphingomonas flavida TaxID=3096154 RepID=UPI002FCB6296
MSKAICHTVTDWAATGAMLQGIGTLIGAIAVIAAAIIGANTFDKWKQQKIAERKRDQAEKILTATYRVRRQLSAVRSPMMWAHETDKAQKDLEERGEWQKAASDADRKSLAVAQAYYDRLNRTKGDQAALEECQPMARALFGEELEQAIEKLLHQFWTVKVYVDANHNDKNGADKAFREKIEGVIWEGYPTAGENEVDKTINEKVILIEKVCVPALRMEKDS